MKEGLDPKSKLELANLLLQIGFREEAIAELLAAASILRESGETEEAIAVYKRVLDLEPENLAAIRGLEEVAPGPPTRRVEEIVSRLGLEEIKPEPAKPTPVKPTLIPGEPLVTPTEPVELPTPPVVAAPAEDQNQVWSNFKDKIRELEEEPDKRLALGERFLQTGMIAEAQAQLELACRLKKTPATIEALARCLLKKGDYPKAVSLIKEGLSAPFTDTEKLSLHYLLGTVYQNIDDISKALEEFNQIARLVPDYRNIKELITLLSSALPRETAPPKEVAPPAVAQVTPSPVIPPLPEAAPPSEEKPTPPPPEPAPEEPQAAPVVEERFPVVEEPLPTEIEEEKPEELPPLSAEENIAFL